MAGELQDFWEAGLRGLVPDPAAALDEAFGHLSCLVCQVAFKLPWDYLPTLAM